MTQILADAEMEKRLEGADGPVQVVNEKGTVIGVFTPIKFPHSPYSREELEARRKDLEACREEARNHPDRGKTLSEFWEEMEKLHGGRS